MKSFNYAKPLRWLLTVVVAGSLLPACSDSKTTTEGDKQATPVTDSPHKAPNDTPVKKGDSLPPLDKKAKDKPENGNT